MTGYPRWDAYWAVATTVGGVVPRSDPDDPEYRAAMRVVRQKAPMGWVVVSSHATEADAHAHLERVATGAWVERRACGCVLWFRYRRLSRTDLCDAHAAEQQRKADELDALLQRLRDKHVREREEAGLPQVHDYYGGA